MLNQRLLMGGTDSKVYLYKRGNLYTDLTGGWNTTMTCNFTYEDFDTDTGEYVDVKYSCIKGNLNADRLYLRKSNHSCVYRATKAMDLTGYTKLCALVDFTLQSTSANIYGIFGAQISTVLNGTSMEHTYTDHDGNLLYVTGRKTIIQHTNVSNHIINVDISQLQAINGTRKHYIYANMFCEDSPYSGNMNVYAIWLEK